MSRSLDRVQRLAVVAMLVAAVTLAVGTAVAAAPARPAPPSGPRFNLGQPATPAEIAGWDIDVRPDGAGLPKGRGTVAQGQELYDAKCASCHGTFGESTEYNALAGGVGSLKTDQPQRTVGSKLNHATTLYDYINRAMPFTNPQTLKPDEVYALVAYVLHLNDLLPADGALDQQSLPALRMPNRDGFTTDHGFMTRDGKPDVRNVACMTNCATTVQLASEIPSHARDSHGDLAEQSRTVGSTVAAGTRVAAAPGKATPPAVAAKTPATADLAQKSGCTACHGVANRIVGPGFREIAAKYGGDAGAEGRLIAKVKAGGAGVWGQVPMPPHPQLKDADIKTLVQWVLGGAK